jgi:hypothetical protein
MSPSEIRAGLEHGGELSAPRSTLAGLLPLAQGSRLQQQFLRLLRVLLSEPGRGQLEPGLAQSLELSLDSGQRTTRGSKALKPKIL